MICDFYCLSAAPERFPGELFLGGFKVGSISLFLKPSAFIVFAVTFLCTAVLTNANAQSAWVKQGGVDTSGDYDPGRSIAAYSRGNILVTGETYSNPPGEIRFDQKNDIQNAVQIKRSVL